MCSVHGCDQPQSGYFGSELCHRHYYDVVNGVASEEELVEDEDPTAGFIYESCLDHIARVPGFGEGC